MTKIIVPSVGESVSEATISKWHKKVGDFVEVDEILLELETDKVTLEVNADKAGTVSSILKKEGENVKVGEIVGEIKEGAGAPSPKPASSSSSASAPLAHKEESLAPLAHKEESLAPSVLRMSMENNIDVKNVIGTGKDGRVTKADLVDHLENKKPTAVLPQSGGSTERVKMSRLRKTIATRLKDAQNTAAILTTFNEFDMTNIMEIRKKYQDSFMKKYNIKLGFMSFFTKAAVAALKEIPAINAEIDGDDIVYKNYYNIGVAVGTPQGLVVPIVRQADMMSLAGLELEIANLAKKARDGKLAISDMSGGTFSITNGGVYGSLLSTPIINPPQSGILGLHKIEERPVVIGGKIEIRSMMYAALSYDHRIIDGQEAVTFLVKMKQYIENPETLLLEI